ncbi:MAG: TetR/AcrR family transcriptional regulator [Deltaproteobacteria bacterium]|nr:TetR/AcrR family transcriptional regulator [Deltaproteobacteria bacterium]
MIENAQRNPEKAVKNGAPSGLRERNKRSKRDRILTAARELFSTKGFAATTTREIAERAGVGAGTLFSYARDKRELIYLVLRDELDQVEETAFETVPREAPLVEQLMHVFGRYFDAYERDRSLALDLMRERYHMFLDAGSAGEEMTGMTLSFLEKLAALVDAARRRDRLRSDFPALTAATSFFALYLLVVDSWVGSPWQLPRASFEGLLRDGLLLQVEGLRDRSPARPRRSR